MVPIEALSIVRDEKYRIKLVFFSFYGFSLMQMASTQFYIRGLPISFATKSVRSSFLLSFLFANYNFSLDYDAFFSDEKGHNFGHPHHLTNLYQWRFDRGQVEFGYDTWDLMSGGNQWPISDFAAASKWHYNWITDDAIILMQPEGSTTECPSCVSSVNNLVLRPFDDDMVLPSSSNIMGVHIPILGSLGGGFPDTAYSYWLSYRSKIPQPSLGLSVHVVEFALQNNTIFGATYDSLNFDAFGHTETPFDSFVLPDTCYFLSPPGQILDLNPDAVEQVLPVVCVESVDGASITISVYFLNPDSPPPDAIAPASTRQLGCSESGSSVGNLQLDLSNNQFHMFKYVGTGMGGTIVLDICVQNGPTSRATAYFYDQYPYAYLADLGKGSQPEYGAFRSFRIEDRCAGQSTRTYNSEYGETYVLVVPDESLEEELLVIATSACTVSRCHVNQYLSIGQCNDCPAGSVAKSGSRSILECESCTDDGFDVLHPKSALCTLPTAPSVFRKATNQEWRALTVGSLLATGVFWMISDFRFYSQPNCSADSLIDISAATIKSGRWQITWPPDRAFDDDPESVWGGVPDSRSLTFIGVDFGEGVAVNCIVLKQSPFHPATKALIQAKAEGETEWKTVHIASDMVDGENVIQLDFPPTPQPTDPPTTTPTLVPTPLPTSPPISPPSKSPSLSPMPIPPSVPSEQPTKSPTLAPILIDSPSPIPSPAPTSCQREECDAFFGLGILKGTKYNANVLGLCVEKCIIPLFEGLFALFLSCGPCP